MQQQDKPVLGGTNDKNCHREHMGKCDKEGCVDEKCKNSNCHDKKCIGQKCHDTKSHKFEE